MYSAGLDMYKKKLHFLNKHVAVFCYVARTSLAVIT